MNEEANNNKAKELVLKVKTYVQEMPTKRKIIVAALLAFVIIAAIVVTVLLNQGKTEYVPLYSGLSQQETSEIYVALKDKGADVQVDSSGNLTVPKDQYDIWLLQMAAEGYPQSTLTYDVFSKNTGLTTTESEKQTWLVNQLQDRIQQTLKRINGVNNAVVTISAPKTSDYVWQQASDKQKASASVLLTLASGVTLSSDQVTAIKNLVAKSVEDLAAGDVSVVDAGTGTELTGKADTSKTNGGLTDAQSLSLEQDVQQQIENNVERLLAARYGSSGVVAAAKVTLNYDAMMTETMTPTQTQDGKGYLRDYTEKYGVNGTNTTASGVVGEENNTDIPSYSYTSPDKTGGMTNYQREMKYDYGYIKTQVEKGNAVLSRATISVLVNENNLGAARKQELISLISNATDIAPQYITVSSMSTTGLNTPAATQSSSVSGLPFWVYIAIGVGVLLLILIIVLLILRRRRARAEAEMLEEEEEEEAPEEYEEGENLEDEIDEYKKQLEEAAKASIDQKDQALVTDIQDFAKENPEITANLLRTWMREGE